MVVTSFISYSPVEKGRECGILHHLKTFENGTVVVPVWEAGCRGYESPVLWEHYGYAQLSMVRAARGRGNLVLLTELPRHYL